MHIISTVLFYAATALLGQLVGIVCVIFGIVRSLPKPSKGTIAFFHPFADGGGGGERVLWCAVKAVEAHSPHAKIFIYAREGINAADLVRDASKRFNIVIDGSRLSFIPLKHTSLILPERYPRLTLLGQGWGAVRLGREALSQLVPELFIDTTGWAFTFPLARLAGSKVSCYVHYPTISTNMIERVSKGNVSYNNDQRVAGSALKSAIKLLYYKAFAIIYGAMGLFSRATMVNSSWTRGHIRKLWWRHQREEAVSLVYPPVDTEGLQTLPLDRRLKPLSLISIAQFRPEKDQRKQLEAFALSKRVAGDGPGGRAVRVARLKMVGSCRNKDDEERLSQLKDLADDLGIKEDVDWCINVTYHEMKVMLGEAVGGLHTMVDEHFGISVVEYQAAGVIPIAHDSGGPKADIVVSPHDQKEGKGEGKEKMSTRLQKHTTGYLADSVEEYAQAIAQVLMMDLKERLQVASAAREHSTKFSTQHFEEGFIRAIVDLLPKE